MLLLKRVLRLILRFLYSNAFKAQNCWRTSPSGHSSTEMVAHIFKIRCGITRMNTTSGTKACDKQSDLFRI
jgi:hypothetical protein